MVWRELLKRSSALTRAPTLGDSGLCWFVQLDVNHWEWLSQGKITQLMKLNFQWCHPVKWRGILCWKTKWTILIDDWFAYIDKYPSFSNIHPPSHILFCCNFPVRHYVALYLCIHCIFLDLCISSSLSTNGSMADASVVGRLCCLFVLVPTATKRLKISCLFFGCLALGMVSHGGCKGYCLQDLHRPSFPSREGLLQLDGTARRRVERGRDDGAIK